jgi:anaerobic magnesium-protoporphyrin IX monomethyl ester cyclase
MLKVVLVNPPQFTGYPQPPMGLALIAAVLEKHGFTASVLDANLLRLKPEEIPSRIADADIVGLTAMTPTIGAAMRIARHVKRAMPNVTIILGGGHATLLPKETLSSIPEVDILVVGEGENTVVRLLEALEHGKQLDGVPGISYRQGNQIVHNQASQEDIDLDSLPFLAYHLLPWRSYRPHPPHGRAYPFAALITSRGCPYQCSYCSKPIFGSRFRAQSPDRVMSEITYYREQFATREIAFYDDVFTLDKERAHAIADEIIKSGIKVGWTCETRVNLVDGELLRHMREAGCYGISYGIETASPEILDSLNKGISPRMVQEAVRLSKEAGLETTGYFMLGCPGETTETIEATIKFAKDLGLDFAQFSITVPFPGTKLYAEYLKNGGNAIPWESFVYSRATMRRAGSFVNAGISGEELDKWVSRAYRQFYLRPSYMWQRIRETTSLGDLRVDINGISMLLENVRRRRE